MAHRDLLSSTDTDLSLKAIISTLRHTHTHFGVIYNPRFVYPGGTWKALYFVNIKPK